MKRLAVFTHVANWPFAVKMGIGPALAMLALIWLAVFGIQEASRQARLVREVVDQDLVWAEGLSATAAHLQRINGRIYRLAALQASHDPDLNIDREVADLIEQTAALGEELNVYALASLSRADYDELNGLIADVRLYRDMLDVFGSMLAI